MKELTLTELIDEYHKADREGRKWLSKVTSEKNNDLNTIATQHMNLYTSIKRQLLYRIGQEHIKGIQNKVESN